MEQRRVVQSVYLSILVFCSLTMVTGAQNQGQDKGERRTLSPESATSEQERQLPPLDSPTKPVNCPIAGRYIDNAISSASEAKGTYLLAIVRPGKGEASPRLSDLRLRQIKAYLEYTRFPNYVLATGERVPGYGRIDVFVAGRLLYTLPLPKDRGINLLSCVAV